MNSATKIAILGADGYYGYPLVERLVKNYTVLGLDNFWRRNLKDSPSLIPINRDYPIENCDVSNHCELFNYLNNFQPDIVIHLAEQRSAPYSMKDVESKNFTINNNTSSTINVMECAKELGFRTIHIGTMGVYGYNNDGTITEGDKTRSPGSIYHLSKCFDNSIFEFYNRIYGCAVTELHQGIIWGIGGRFDYDETFGTVLNRFILQSMLDIKLTLYGSGLQKRPFINIKNSLDCVQLVIKNGPNGFDTYNQYTEIKSLNELIDYPTKNYKNPRIENENNSLFSTNEKLLKLGLNPIYICKEEVEKIKEQILPYIGNVKKDLIWPKTNW